MEIIKQQAPVSCESDTGSCSPNTGRLFKSTFGKALEDMDKLIHLIHSYLNFYKHSLSVCVCVYTCEGAAHCSVLLCILSSQRPGRQAWWCTTHPNTHTLDSEMIHFSWTQESNFILWLLFLLSPWPLCLWDVNVSFSRAQAGQTHHPPASPLMWCNQWPIGTAWPSSPLQNVKQSWAFSFRSWISVWAATVSNQWLPACGDHINVLQGFLP